LVGSFLLAIGILFIYQIAQYDYYKPIYHKAHIEENQVVVRDDGQFVLENTTRFTSNDSNFVETFWTSSNFDFEYSSVREGERYAGPSLAVLGAIVFLLSLSLCMWLKISGKIIVLQSTSENRHLLTMQETSGTIVLNPPANGEAIPLQTYANSTPSPTVRRASRSPRHSNHSPVPSPVRSPHHVAAGRMSSSSPLTAGRAGIPTYDQISLEQSPTPNTTPHLCRHHRRVQSSLVGSGSPAASPLFARQAATPSSAQRQSSLRIPPASSVASPAHALRATLPPNAPPPAYADVFPN